MKTRNDDISWNYNIKSHNYDINCQSYDMPNWKGKKGSYNLYHHFDFLNLIIMTMS